MRDTTRKSHQRWEAPKQEIINATETIIPQKKYLTHNWRGFMRMKLSIFPHWRFRQSRDFWIVLRLIRFPLISLCVWCLFLFNFKINETFNQSECFHEIGCQRLDHNYKSRGTRRALSGKHRVGKKWTKMSNWRVLRVRGQYVIPNGHDEASNIWVSGRRAHRCGRMEWKELILQIVLCFDICCVGTNSSKYDPNCARVLHHDCV